MSYHCFLPQHHMWVVIINLPGRRIVTGAVVYLLATGCILKVDKLGPFICSPLFVVEGSNKKRLVINLRQLNSFY